MARSSQVSGTEASLSRALFDAVSLLRPGRTPIPGLTVTNAQRVKALSILQKHRPDLDHTSLTAVVDAAAAWTGAEQDDLVMPLLRAVGGDDMVDATYAVLTGPARVTE